jgi:threonine dehydrogenase-like Zn-dependent dehydrogenase
VGDRRFRGLRLRFGATALNHRLLAILGRPIPRLARGWMPWLELARLESPPLPGPDWVRLRPILSGICGSDLALLTGRSSPVLSPFASFPAVLGHEVVAEVTNAGPGAEGWQIGERVVVDPVIGCAVRGFQPCPPCALGRPGLCRRQADGPIAPGVMIGFCRELPGGWGEELIAHVSQLHRVPAALSDEEAVLVEPLSVALHAVLAAGVRSGDRVLVLGAGSIGLLVLGALALLGTGAQATVLARHRAQRAMAERLGTTQVVADGASPEVERALVEAAGGVLHRPFIGPPVSSGGFDVVFDCVGSKESLDRALRLVTSGGTLVVVGGPSVIRELDWTLVWTREVRVLGSFVYGRESSMNGEPHTFELAMQLIDRNRVVALGGLVTHRFALDEWPAAIRASLDRRSGTIKTVFAPAGRT